MKLAWILIFGFYLVLMILIYARLINRWRRDRKKRRAKTGGNGSVRKHTFQG